MIAIAAALLQTAAPTIADARALTLFRSACVDGSAVLRKNEAVQVFLSDLPKEARQAFAQSQIEVGEINLEPSVPSAKKTGNVIYRLRGDPEAYLMLPVQGEKAKGFSTVCGIVVAGDWTSEAAKLFPDPFKVGTLSAVDESSGGVRAIPYRSAAIDGKMMVVAYRNGWTLASVGADERPARLRN